MSADARARAAACDPSRSFIVQAPAGSGKTTLLTQRLLALLPRIAEPESLLAITFTRKAAAEMRARVLESLARAASGAAPRDAAEAVTLPLAGAALAHAASRGWDLAAQPGRLRILTIDALNGWLASRLPVLSRAGASLSVEPEPAALYALAARRTLAELEAGGELTPRLETLLAHFDNEVERFETLLAEMLSGRDRWLKPVLAARGAPGPRRRAAREAALADRVRARLARVAALLPPALATELDGLARDAARRLAPEAPEWRPLADRSPGPLPAMAAALPAWQRLAALLVTDAGRWRRAVDRRQGFAPAVAADKAAFLALLARLAAIDGLEAAVAEVAALPAPAYSDEQWRAVEALNDVLLAAAARLGEVFAEHGRVDFAAIGQAALQALGAPDEPSDLTLELDYRVQHVLVDEFQDTSSAQVALLERLTAGWQPGDGRTLFLVGDPMQSIYGFRERNVGLFLGIRTAGLGALTPEPLTLEANFRSRPALIEWINATFAGVFPRREDLARGAVPYSASRAERAPAAGAALQWHVLPEASREAEGRAVAALIASERAADPGARIAVLARGRAQLAPVATALRAAGLRYQGLELVPLADRPVVRDLIALTRALLHPADRIAWLACLRAPWCGLELSGLHALAGGADAATLWQALGTEPALERLSASQRRRVERCRGVFAAALGERGRRPLGEFIASAWVALGGPATATGPGDLDDARTLFKALDRLERAGDLEDPAALESQLERLYAAVDPDADAGLQLLTVHRAKGLEWPIVIVTGLGRSGRGQDPQLLRWLEVAREDGETGLVLAPHRARAVASERLERYLQALERERDELEQGRLLYVATTRAMERAHLVTHVDRDAEGALRAPRRGTPLATLWPAVESEVRAAAGEAAAEPAAAARAPPALVRLADDWTLPAVEAELPPLTDPPAPERPSDFEFEWVSAAARHVGTLVHEELERAGRIGLEAFGAGLGQRAGAWRRRLVELGVAAASLASCLARVERALVTTTADPRGRWLFDPRHLDAGSEVGLTSADFGRLTAVRIDRTFIDAAGVRWIVDFKTSEHEGQQLEAFLDQERVRYHAQLGAYAALLARLEPGRAVRLGLYFPLHRGWREWAPGEPL